MRNRENTLKTPTFVLTALVLNVAILAFVLTNPIPEANKVSPKTEISKNFRNDFASDVEVSGIDDEFIIEDSAEDEIVDPEDDMSSNQENLEEIEILKCSYCLYVSIDKFHALPESYIPEVEYTGLAGGGQLLPEVVTALKEFFNSAKKDGINLYILSAYRSYDTQAYTLNFWINRELSYGRSREEAEIRANSFSAKPGHSEHQLGTTVDLKDAKCGSYSPSCNRPAYDYIAQNAHEFGFAVSYPKGAENLTGYKHEPWHVRFIGKELAQQFYDTGYLERSGDYLSKFLEERNLDE